MYKCIFSEFCLIICRINSNVTQPLTKSRAFCELRMNSQKALRNHSLERQVEDSPKHYIKLKTVSLQLTRTTKYSNS